MDPREERGIAIAKRCNIVKKGFFYMVPSQSSSVKYTVVLSETTPFCSLPGPRNPWGPLQAYFCRAVCTQSPTEPGRNGNRDRDVDRY